MEGEQTAKPDNGIFGLGMAATYVVIVVGLVLVFCASGFCIIVRKKQEREQKLNRDLRTIDVVKLDSSSIDILPPGRVVSMDIDKIDLPRLPTAKSEGDPGETGENEDKLESVVSFGSIMTIGNDINIQTPQNEMDNVNTLTPGNGNAVGVMRVADVDGQDDEMYDNHELGDCDENELDGGVKETVMGVHVSMGMNDGTTITKDIDTDDGESVEAEILYSNDEEYSNNGEQEMTTMGNMTEKGE